MDTKVLYVTAIILAAISGGYYYFSGSSQKLQVDNASSMTSTADNINLTQTNEKGELTVRAEADRLEQNLQNKTSKLENMNASMYKQGQVESTYYAKLVNGYDDNSKVVLSQGVVATKILQDGQLEFKTETLTGFPKTQEIETDKTVEVTTPQAEFISQGLKANLNDGQYEFFNIRGKYEPNS
ncbi:LPS export ABC transporter periplasmic protein LptC [Acinetobacter schindleri]|uniref:LPS export ABC transporter periplasmic protein LptC n=1 Tax=Acinetobacter schindleri TaxID=108981 RepID=UPI000972827F|nr:LPS export ABC transporter periplasmic protein LptC [Acinetobacter schindleri]APX62570.1 lipopolysccharide assembly LptC-related protein [Acinetobacter schindleri]